MRSKQRAIDSRGSPCDQKKPGLVLYTMSIIICYVPLFVQSIFRALFSPDAPAMSPRSSDLEERRGEIRLQLSWTASLVKDKAAIPGPSATQPSRHFKRCQSSSLKREARRSIGKRTGGLTMMSRRILLATIAALNAGLVDGSLLVDLPSGFKCAWYNLEHPAQFAILFLMVGVVYFINRLFNEVDKVMYARLSCATEAWMDEIRHSRQVYQPVAT
ncbi:unnamed protein product [Ectocarpus sp. CCAP 1310/34]|nr:unnamed protein product [Ectocarpus sp. CCAP 1310/34]